MKFFILSFLLMVSFVQILTVKLPKIKGIEQDPAYLDWYDIRGVKMVKYNKSTLVLNGKFTIKRPLSKVQYSLKFARKVGSSYMPIPLVTVDKADYCSFLENPNIRPMMENMFNHMTLEYSCNHEPGEYEIKNYIPQIPPELPPGDYRGEYAHYFENECIGRMEYYIAWVEL